MGKSCYRKRKKRGRKRELGEEGVEKGEKRQTGSGKVHPENGGPAPLVFCEGEMLHNVY